MAIKSYTTEQLKKMKSETDYERLAKMTDDDIDFSDSPNVYDLLMSGKARIVENPVLKAIREEEAKKAEKAQRNQWMQKGMQKVFKLLEKGYSAEEAKKKLRVA
jgi:RPA family protein